MKTYPKAGGSFWYGLLGFIGIPTGAAIVGRLLNGAQADNIQNSKVMTNFMLCYAAAAGASIYFHDKVPGNWQSSVKWGGIGSGLNLLTVGWANTVLKSDQALQSYQALPYAPPPPAPAKVGGVDYSRIKRFYGLP